MRRGVSEDRFFVGLHERYDESLQLMAHWLGWDVRILTTKQLHDWRFCASIPYHT